MTLVTYRRSGGPRPRSDELLEIGEAGAATLRRVVSARAAGEFADNLSESAVKRLAKAVDAVDGASVTLKAPGRPPYETEEVTTGAGTFRFHLSQKLPKPVAALADRLREISEDLLDHPMAGIEVVAAPPTVRLSAVGSSPCEVNWNGSPTYDLFGEDEGLLKSGELSVDLPGGPTEVAPGWSIEIPLPNDLDFNPKCTLQVRVTFAMKYNDGTWRDAQITAVAGKGWF